MSPFRRSLAVALAAALVLPCMPAAAADMPDFTRLVAEEGRAVVNISAPAALPEPYPLPSVPELPDDGELYEFLRRFLDPEVPRDPEAYSLGSGFLISEDGYILTNAHVLSDAAPEEIVVRLADRREFDARVIGYDLATDIGLIKIEARGLAQVRIGDPARLQPGEWVAAIGSPFGFERSVTAGIVSAKGRFLPGESFVPFIQTDVAVNPGNSGGPLFNLRGEVVGVNSVILSDSGGYMGLSFAIPIDVAMDVAAQLRAHGKVTRGRIGVRIQELTRDLARALRLPAPAGALVTEVEPEGPADLAGMRAGDVIVRFGGRPVESPADLLQHAASAKPGDRVRVEWLRQGATLAAALTIDELRPMRLGAPRPAPAAEAPALPGLGLRLAPLTPQQRERLGIGEGLLVQRSEGAAQRAGLQRGDIILAVNGEPAGTAARFSALLAKSGPGSTAALLVQRGGVRLFTALRVPR
jgi:serine protease Do